MKTPNQVVGDVRRRLQGSWHVDAARPAETAGDDAEPSAWPLSCPLGTVPKSALEAGFERYQQTAFVLRDWAAANDLPISDTARRVHGTNQRLPSHVTVSSVDVAARLCGKDWTNRLARGRARAAQLRSRFAEITDLPRIIRDVDKYSDLDFELLCAAGDWFRRHSAIGLTPRQVPVPGLHAKWLSTHQATVATLVGIPNLGLLAQHPARLHFTYLDPLHRANGGRWHDSATVGDAAMLAYRPTVVIISENKDTALHFPELAGGISVEGMGYGGTTAAAIPWLKRCPQLFYWGDLDAAGFEILNGFREAGLHVASILMDLPTYERYERFGTPTDARGSLLTARMHRPLPYLTEPERRLYDCLTDPSWQRYRRVEQERIPLDVAVHAVQSKLRTASVN